eukprot:UN21767
MLGGDFTVITPPPFNKTLHIRRIYSGSSIDITSGHVDVFEPINSIDSNKVFERSYFKRGSPHPHDLQN